MRKPWTYGHPALRMGSIVDAPERTRMARVGRTTVRRRCVRRRVVLLVLGVAAPLLIAAPAQAERWTARDPRGDVQGYQHDPDPEPCGTITDVDASDNTGNDIARLTIGHRAHAVRVRVHFQDLVATGRQFTEVLLRTGDAKGHIVEVSHLRGGGVRTFFYEEPTPDLGDEDCGGVIVAAEPCDGLGASMSARHDVVSLHVPRDCLSEPPWVRGAASSYTHEHGTTYHDMWATPGPSGTGWASIGPRVHRG